MRILIPTPIFPPEIGGPATYVSELANRLSKKHQVSVITFTQNPERSTNYNLISIPTHKHFLGVFFRQFKLALEIFKQGRNADIIYAQGPVVVGLVAVSLGKILAKPCILKFVGDISWEEAQRRAETKSELEEFLGERKTYSTRFLQLIQRRSLLWATKIVTPSKYLKDLMTKHYAVNKKKIEVIHNAVEIPRIKTKSRKKEIRTIITAGRLVPHKRFDLVIEAFKNLKDSDVKKLKLVIVGEGPEKIKLKTQISNLPAGEAGRKIRYQINMLDPLPKESYLKLLAAADLFVLASSYEGLPHAIIEAMLLRVPVVATDIPGTREVIRHNQSGLLVEANAKALSQAMRKALTDKKLANRLRTNAFKHASQTFNWDTHLKRLVHLFGQESSPV